MRVIDSISAWAIFLTGFAYVIVVGYWHPRGTVLDTPLFWIVVAMINFLRLSQGDSALARLRVISIAANLMAFALEFFRFGLFATRTATTWGSQYIFSELRTNLSWWVPYFVIAISALVETVCSVRRTCTAEPV
jgi:hypothetical protein